MDPAPALSFALPEAVAVSGAWSGLGKGLCRLLAERGVFTIGVDLNPAPQETSGLAKYQHVIGDVGHEATWEVVVAKVQTHNPRTLGLVTSAAVLEVGTILEARQRSIARTLNVNVI